jgi:hypothetical protein
MSCARLSLDRVLFALAGTMTFLSIALAVTVSPWFLVLGAFVAANQWLFTLVGVCPASVVLGRTPCSRNEMAQ